MNPDRAGTDRAGTDRAGTDRAGTDRGDDGTGDRPGPRAHAPDTARIAVTTVDGQMVGRPVLERARRILAARTPPSRR
ncbi:hypothetical protein [Streptomyces odontomachi]|uniref:hypothetical protein n=1 Tax=Streptomyces odontomachi TaxID=2944940 RepID=UPI00210D3323|nr:hypothetical protein [Streptomyces sp. ODS25]